MKIPIKIVQDQENTIMEEQDVHAQESAETEALVVEPEEHAEASDSVSEPTADAAQPAADAEPEEAEDEFTRLRKALEANPGQVNELLKAKLG